MEIRCYHKILHISYKDHVTNKKVCAKIQQAIGPHEDLLSIVKRYKLKWYGQRDYSFTKSQHSFLKGECLSSVFSSDGTLISTFGRQKRR